MYVVVLETLGELRIFGPIRSRERAEEAAKYARPQGWVIKLEHPTEIS